MGDDGRYDPEQLQRGYRYYRALEHQRRGYVVVRELVRGFLHARRWELRQPEHLERASLELVDVLLVAGAVTLYQCGVNDENWRDHQARQEKLRAGEIAEQLRAAANEARDDEHRRVAERIAELEAEREAERWKATNRRQLAELEEEERKRTAGVAKLRPVIPTRRGR